MTRSPASAPTPLVAIVDDDAGVCRALGRLVRSQGFAAASFGSGEALLEALGERVPDCVLLDLNLPGLDGIDVLKRLRGRPDRIAVVTMTGFDRAGLGEQCLALGAAAFVRKPIGAAELADALETALGRALPPGDPA